VRKTPSLRLGRSSALTFHLTFFSRRISRSGKCKTAPITLPAWSLTNVRRVGSPGMSPVLSGLGTSNGARLLDQVPRSAFPLDFDDTAFIMEGTMATCSLSHLIVCV